LRLNTKDLSEALAQKMDISQQDSRKIVKSVLTFIQESVQKGDKVTLSGFGCFYRTTRKARAARNPKTGEKVSVAQTDVPRFKSGRTFRKALNEAPRKKKKKKSEPN
jgi:DNA-binding protein HU-beta